MTRTSILKKLSALIAAASLALLTISCEDRANTLGTGLMPDYTKSHTYDAAFDLTYRTVSADADEEGDAGAVTGKRFNRMYVSSNYGYIGRIPDSGVGAVETEYLTQLYCPEGFLFRDRPYEDRIDSAALTLYYDSYSGYGKDLIEVTAYALDRPLPVGDKYSLKEISDYYTPGVSRELGSASYIAEKGSDGKGSYITIPVSRELGQEIYDKSRSGSPDFAGQEAFDRYFPGIYFRVSAGTGNVLRVVRTALTMHYSVEQMLTSSSGKVDSLGLVHAVQELSHSSEVPQLSRFANEGTDRLIGSGSEYAYVKSPAGVLAEITIPTREIKRELDAAPEGSVRVLSSAPFAITGESRDLSEYGLSYPTNLVLMPRDSVVPFFEQELSEADSPYTTYISSQAVSGSSTFSFGNISAMIAKHIEEQPDRDLRVVLVPVQYTATTQQSSYGSTAPSSVTNLVLPSALTIRMDGVNNRLRVYINERKEGSPF